MRRLAFVILAATATMGMVALQGPPAEVNPRDLQLRQLDWQETVLLNMADSMPESLYRDKVTPEQRDFAQQLFHAAMFPPTICSIAILGEQPAPADTAAILNSAEALKGFITESFEGCKEIVRNQTDEDRAALTRGFEGDQVPKSEVLDQCYLHTAYTVGQVVANFRKHGMAPPEFPFF
jgi:hypothetical protein